MANIISLERRRTFLAKLLAPLPDDAEPAKTKQVEAEMKATIKDRFWLTRFQAERAWHLLKAASLDGMLVRVAKTEPTWDRSTRAEIDAAANFIVAMSEMMRVPAITRQMLSDKQSAFKKWGVSYTVKTREMGIAARARWQEYLDEDVTRLARQREA